MSLLHKTFSPHHKDTHLLPSKIIQKFLSELSNGWDIDKSGKLYKECNFTNFAQAMDFANKIATLAEKEGHHPDLTISWGKCLVQLLTHEIKGLTKKDFILAAKINGL